MAWALRWYRPHERRAQHTWLRGLVATSVRADKSWSPSTCIVPAAYCDDGNSRSIITRWRPRSRQLLLLTDGKPSDSDHYEGRYTIEDMRMAIRKATARARGPSASALIARCTTIFPISLGRGLRHIPPRRSATGRPAGDLPPCRCLIGGARAAMICCRRRSRAVVPHVELRAKLSRRCACWGARARTALTHCARPARFPGRSRGSLS